MKLLRTTTCLVAAVFLAGCSVLPKFAYRTVVEPCPSAPPATSCPDWPVETPTTLAQTLYGLGKGWAAWDACKASTEAWERAWEVCAKEAGR